MILYFPQYHQKVSNLISNYLTSSTNQWTTAGDYGATGDLQICGVNGRYIQFTGVQLEAGDVATTFENRSWAEELVLCHRYFFRYQASIVEWVYCESNYLSHKFWWYPLPQEMRASPSWSHAFTHSTSNGVTISNLTLQGQSKNRILTRVHYSGNSGSSNTMHHTDGWNGEYCYADAEL